MLYFRAINGDAISETDGNGNTTNEYVFMAGRRIARRNSSGNVYYYYSDALGSPMTITDSSGNQGELVVFAHFGEGLDEEIARAGGSEKRKAPVAGAGDEVEVARTVTPSQALSHKKKNPPTLLRVEG